ncbi:MAG: ribonuclease H-like domain-containing protein [Thermoanaerobaculaceae bacterium]|nr:ribonuclease H-like domain-containing protein [Thermoanaerobaculaceae bacterium]MDI9621625.1 ribonuclease H-like domain-containing protein [Acidobacteriota bacterium]
MASWPRPGRLLSRNDDGRFGDLLWVFRRSIVFTYRATGLITLARYVGFEWRDGDPGGSESMAWRAEYVDDPVGKMAFRNRVITCNEDDVRAAVVLADWLEQNTTNN